MVDYGVFGKIRILRIGTNRTRFLATSGISGNIRRRRTDFGVPMRGLGRGLGFGLLRRGLGLGLGLLRRGLGFGFGFGFGLEISAGIIRLCLAGFGLFALGL